MAHIPSVSGETWIYFDVDDTLVIWPPRKDRGFVSDIVIDDPYEPPKRYALKKHIRHIEELKEFKTNPKCKVVIWSRGGKPWAEEVIKALGLEAYVDFIIQKPDITYDDEHQKFWFPMTPRWRKDEGKGSD